MAHKAACIDLRWSREDDASELSAVHAEAWRNAYSGVIPGAALSAMISRRGPRYWAAAQAAGAPALLLAFDGRIGGYATLGPARRGRGRGGGEIYELYLRPEFQGLGFGTRLFGEARVRLVGAGLEGLSIWSLAENRGACGFYRAMGGVVAARNRERVGGAYLAKVCFVWP